jgi:glyceraldehyde-3-phosphate dehydrogenase type I
MIALPSSTKHHQRGERKFMINIAINGFGRIGRTFFRTFFDEKMLEKDFNLVAINMGPTATENVELYAKYDSVMGTFPAAVHYSNGALTVDNHTVNIFTEKDPTTLPWKDLKVDWVIEASGHFTNAKKAQLHQKAGAKKVLITAPGIDEDITIIPGINNAAYNPHHHHIVSLGSCTTNAFAPLVKIIKENFTLTNGMMTTVHAYTNDQALLDGDNKDPRRARAAALNIVPTKTGADRVITKIYPELEGRLRAIAIRVPVSKVSLIDFTFFTKEKLTQEHINSHIKNYVHGTLKGILEYTSHPLVSSDFAGTHASATVDLLLTHCVETTGKIVAWYDNEVGYCMRLIDFLLHNALHIE